MRRLIATAAIVAAAFMPSTAWAWGNEGHKVVALIAASELSPAAKAQVEQLLGGDATNVGDVSGLDGKTVDIAGTVKLYKGKPDIVIQSRDRITVH
jgi:hypothetical protein